MNALYRHPPVLGFAARSGAGKTTLLTRILPLLRQRGLHVGVIKHSHHDIELDTPGKDSYRLRKAGAEQMLLACPYRQILIREQTPPQEPRLEPLLHRLDRTALDLILVEGFRHLPFPKIEVIRGAVSGQFLHHEDPSIIAVATDARIDTRLTQIDLNDPAAVVEFIQQTVLPPDNGESP